MAVKQVTLFLAGLLLLLGGLIVVKYSLDTPSLPLEVTEHG